MTTPTIFPAQFDPSIGDVFAKAPELRNGATQDILTEVTIPASTATTTVVGLLPFQKGFRINYSSRILVEDLDTGTDVTFDLGYVYDDDGTFTNDPNAFISGSTVAQNGGFDLFNATAGFQFIAEDNGWIALTLGGGSTTTEGTVKLEALIAYDETSVIS